MTQVTEFPAMSLKALVTNLIDYAGIFPPAKLPLREAFPKYLEYRNGKYNWMLSRFIIPAALLPELGKLLDDIVIEDTEKIPLSIIVRGKEDDLKDDLDALTRFNSKYGGRFTADVFEIKLPDTDNVFSFMAAVNKSITGSLEYEARFFFEGGTSLKGIEAAAEALRKYNDEDGHTPAGFKLRTGGEVSSAYPSPETAARVLKACKDFKLPFKATAGLHHPYRHYNEGAKAHMHGFINLFGAAAMLDYHNIDEDKVLAMVNDENAGNFNFRDEELEWNGLTIPTGKITLARKEFCISYGSCSFYEPVEDLQRLNLL
jgi:hypothetical protein